MALIKGRKLVNKVVKQIDQFQKGEIKPLATGIDHLDHHLLGGFYPSTVLSIVALSQHGKTYMMEEILTSLEQEHGDDVVFIKNLWELSLFKVVVREMAKESDQSVRQVLNELPDEDIAEIYKEICDRYREDNIYLCPLPVTPDEFYEDTLEIIKKYPDKKIVVTLDNLENVLLDDETQKKTMDRIIQMINLLNKEHPYICWIILNQLNREYALRLDNPMRHLIQEGDIYGSSALFKLSDVVVAKMLPYRFGLDRYMVFANSRYEYIDQEFKYMGDNTSQFRAMGNAFYQYLKSRDIEEEYDRPDLFVEDIFEAPPEPEEETVNRPKRKRRVKSYDDQENQEEGKDEDFNLDY